MTDLSTADKGQLAAFVVGVFLLAMPPLIVSLAG